MPSPSCKRLVPEVLFSESIKSHTSYYPPPYEQRTYDEHSYWKYEYGQYGRLKQNKNILRKKISEVTLIVDKRREIQLGIVNPPIKFCHPSMTDFE